MAIEFVAGTIKTPTVSPGRTGNGDLTIAFPTSYTPTAGHLALIILYNDQGDASTPTDWTEVTGSPWGSATPKLQAFYKVLAGGESNPVTTISGSGTNLSHCANMAIYSGVDPTTPIDTVGTASAGTGTPMTAGSIDPTADNAMVLGLCGRGDNESSSGQTFGGSTTGVTEQLDGGTNAGSDSQVSMYDKLIATGASGDGSATTSATDPWVSVLIALKPPPAAYEINAEPGSYAVTGAALTVLADRLIDLSPGSYAITGLDAALSRGFEINAEPGAYALDGAAGTLLADRLINAEPGTYAVDGIAATLARGYFIVAESGSYIVTGAAAQVLKDYAINAELGEYVVTGQAATLLADRLLNLEPGSYEIVGPDATLVYAPVGAYELNCEPGVYEITGAAATMLADRLINAAPGSYLITGPDANLVYSGGSLINPGDEVQVLVAPNGIACTVLIDNSTAVKVVTASAIQIHVSIDGGTPIKVVI